MREKYYIVDFIRNISDYYRGHGYGYGVVADFNLFLIGRDPYLRYRFAESLILCGKYTHGTSDRSLRIELSPAGITLGTHTGLPMFVVIRGGQAYEYLTGLPVTCVDLKKSGGYYYIGRYKPHKETGSLVDIYDHDRPVYFGLSFLLPHAKKITRGELQQKLKDYGEAALAEMAQSVRRMADEAAEFEALYRAKVAETAAKDAAFERDIRMLGLDRLQAAGGTEALRVKPQLSVKYCPDCGTESPAAAEVCPKCGRSICLSQERTDAVLEAFRHGVGWDQDRAREDKRQQRIRQLRLIITLIIVLPLILFLINFLFLHSIPVYVYMAVYPEITYFSVSYLLDKLDQAHHS